MWHLRLLKNSIYIFVNNNIINIRYIFNRNINKNSIATTNLGIIRVTIIFKKILPISTYTIIYVLNIKVPFILGVDKKKLNNDNLQYQKQYIYRIIYKNHTITALNQNRTYGNLTGKFLSLIRQL